jgi:hypothetical protein
LERDKRADSVRAPSQEIADGTARRALEWRRSLPADIPCWGTYSETARQSSGRALVPVTYTRRDGVPHDYLVEDAREVEKQDKCESEMLARKVDVLNCAAYFARRAAENLTASVVGVCMWTRICGSVTSESLLGKGARMETVC